MNITNLNWKTVLRSTKASAHPSLKHQFFFSKRSPIQVLTWFNLCLISMVHVSTRYVRTPFFIRRDDHVYEIECIVVVIIFQVLKKSIIIIIVIINFLTIYSRLSTRGLLGPYLTKAGREKKKDGFSKGKHLTGR